MAYVMVNSINVILYVSVVLLRSSFVTVLSTLERQKGEFANVEVDEEALLVGHVGAKACTYNHVPRRSVQLVELFLEKCGDVLLHFVQVDRLYRQFKDARLHLLGQVGCLENG